MQMTKLPTFRKIRRANFERFLSNMEGTTFGLPAEPYGFNCDWLAFPMLSAHRNEVCACTYRAYRSLPPPLSFSSCGSSISFDSFFKVLRNRL